MEDFWVFHNRLKFTWFLLGDNTSSFPVPYSYRIDIGFPKSVGPRDGGWGQHSGVNPGANTSLGQTQALTLEIPSWMGTGIFHATKRTLFLLFDIHAHPQIQGHFGSYPSWHKLIWYILKTFHLFIYLKFTLPS